MLTLSERHQQLRGKDVEFHGKPEIYAFGELDVLVPAYAATIHKGQGPEYPAVIIPVMTQHFPMLQHNLLCTSFTRVKHLVGLVGQKRAVAVAVENASGGRRWSKPHEWLALNAGGRPPRRGSHKLRVSAMGARLKRPTFPAPVFEKCAVAIAWERSNTEGRPMV